MQPNLKLSKFKLLLIYSTAAVLSLCSCAGLKKFPTDKIYEVSKNGDACREYQITDYKKLQYKYVRSAPVAACNGTFGFRAADIPKVLDWAEDAIEKCGNKCR